MQETEVEQAVKKAQELMNYKQDREFMDQVLTAQLRLNQIEKSLKKGSASERKRRKVS